MLTNNRAVEVPLSYKHKPTVFTLYPLGDRAMLWSAHYADKEVVREKGSNRGYWVETFLSFAGIGPGWAWCASFVYWCMSKAGHKPSVRFPARVVSFYEWAAQNGRLCPIGDVQRADLFGWINEDGATGHIGFVIKRVDRNTIETIEGNVGKEGQKQGVHRKTRWCGTDKRWFGIRLNED